MGAVPSIEPEIFASAKAEYESKKSEGLSDELLFNHMKDFIEMKTAELAKSKAADGGGEAASEGGGTGGTDQAAAAAPAAENEVVPPAA